MAFVHEQSCECTKSELDLFSVPPTQTSIEQGSWIEYHPITSVIEGSPIEFDVNGSGEDYVDFANTLRYVKAKLVTMTGNDLADDAAVGPVNLFLHKSVFPSGHFTERRSDNGIDQHLSISSHVGNVVELR